MVTQVLNAEVNPLRAFRVETIPSQQLLPMLAVGDVARIVVRQNPQQGLGSILLRGSLIEAALPQNLQAGDVLVAELTESADSQLVFKILDIQRLQAASPRDLIRELTVQLRQLTDNSGAPGLRAPQPLAVPAELAELQDVQVQLKELFRSIGSAAELTDAGTALAKLVSSTDGSLSSSLRETAAAINRVVEQTLATPEARLVASLREALGKLLEGANNNAESSKFLRQILDVLAHEAQEAKLTKSPQKALIRSTLKELGQAQAYPETQSEQIKKVLDQVQRFEDSLKTPAGSLDLKTAAELKTIGLRLEQMASTLETLQQLNPVMQALGEPALILFPFLFQGLIAHSELTIDSRLPQKKKGEEREEEEKEGRKSEPFQRIQVSVPLPSMGNVDLDIAHRGKEIFVRLTVEDAEVGQFLVAQLENLATVLREEGFEAAELVANVGLRREILPAWSVGLHAATSVLA